MQGTVMLRSTHGQSKYDRLNDALKMFYQFPGDWDSATEQKLRCD